ncbi:MAG: hypothetical protein AAF727_13855 [Pseudomonadota bacterium]
MAFLAPLVTQFTGFIAGLGVVGKLIVGVALNAASAAIARRKQRGQQAPGIKTQVTLQGDTNPQSIILGPYATNGQMMTPYYSHTNNPGEGTDFGEIGHGDYATFLVSLADAPMTALDAIIVDGMPFDLATHLTGPVHPQYGLSVASGVDRDAYVDRLWLRFYDGTQTAADTYLVAAYSGDVDRPWKSTSVHSGSAYLILTLKRDQSIFRSFNVQNPVRAVLRGMALLDPRTGQTAYTENPMVMSWNILRGITLPDGRKFGLGVDEADLPSEWWFPAMDECDELVPNESGGTEPAYRAGLEIPIATPDDGGLDALSAIEELNLTCHGYVADLGGTWIARTGGVGVPAFAVEDQDFLNSRDKTFDKFQGLDTSVNVITATFPNPAANWNAKEAPRRTNLAAVAADGEEIVEDFQLDACPFPDQVERFTVAQLKEGTRARMHKGMLPPSFDVALLEGLSWTSARHGYTGKVFEIQSLGLDLISGVIGLGLREAEQGDFTPDAAQYIGQPVPAVVPRVPPGLRLINPRAFAHVLTDGTEPRRPAIRLTWELPSDLVSDVAWRVYLGAELVVSGSTSVPSEGEVIVSEGILPDKSYVVEVRPVADGQQGLWTILPSVRTDAIGIGVADLDGTILQQLEDVTRDALLAESRLTDAVGFTLDEIAERAAHDVGRQILETARVNGVVEEQRIALSAEIATVSEGVDGVADGVAALSATLTQDYRTAAAQDGVTAQLETVLNARFDTNEASIITLSTAVATANQTIASLETSVNAQFAANTANLTTNYYTRSDTDGAIAAAVTDVETDVDGLTTSVTAVQSSINGITGVYSVEIDNNGAISGFGLISDLVDGNPVSDFIVRADAFRFIDASGASGALTPFQIIGSEVFALNLTVRRANIGELAVDTLRIANGSVNERWRSNYGVLQGTGAFQRAGIIYADIKTGVNVYVALHVQFEHGYGNAGPEWGYRIRQDGTVLRERSNMTFGQDQVAMTFHTNTFNLAPEPGFNRRQVVFELEWQGVGNINADPLFEIEARYK